MDLDSFLLGMVAGLTLGIILIGFTAFLFASVGTDRDKRGLSRHKPGDRGGLDPLGRPTDPAGAALYDRFVALVNVAPEKDSTGLGDTTVRVLALGTRRSIRLARPASPRVRGDH